jgi:probable rRNA maturation factor
MILLDPDLEPDSALAAANGQRTHAPGPDKKRAIPTRETLTRYLGKAQAAIGLRGEVTVLLTTDATIRDLNRRFRGKDTATDVLSFPSKNPAAGREKIVGDVAISVETARNQAVEQNHSLAIELRVLMLHGLLHLAGYDHETDGGKMERREQRLRGALGLPLGLIERATLKPAGARSKASAARTGSRSEQTASLGKTRRRLP